MFGTDDAASPRPLLALTAGDPAGIGPEVVVKALADARVRAAARLLVLGPARLAPPDVPRAVSAADALAGEDVAWLDTAEGEDAGPWEPGRADASAGRAAIQALRRGAELAGRGAVAALVTAPVCKEAMHLAGERVEGQTELLARWAGAERVEMLAVARELRVLLLSRHMPLRDALELVTEERVLDRLRLLSGGLASLGLPRPRLALAGLNPHAGERGLLGSEEEDVLRPAVRRAREEGIDVAGPEPPDTVFLRAARGAFDAVLALYHDQAFLPVKIHAPGEAVTVLLGLPYLRVSPAHGTAFDIAGRGVADETNLVSALLQAARWATLRSRR